MNRRQFFISTTAALAAFNLCSNKDRFEYVLMDSGVPGHRTVLLCVNMRRECGKLIFEPRLYDKFRRLLPPDVAGHHASRLFKEILNKERRFS